MGDHFAFSNRTLPHKNFEIPVVEMPPGSTAVYYFRVVSHDFADIRIAFKAIDRFIFYSLTEYFLYGTFYGMILIIALYNLLVYIAIREIKNLYYIFFIVSVALYTLSLDGIGFQYLWPNRPYLNDYASGVTLYMVIMWAIVFTRKFLSTAANAPSLDRLLRWTMIARTALFVVELLFFSSVLHLPQRRDHPAVDDLLHRNTRVDPRISPRTVLCDRLRGIVRRIFHSRTGLLQYPAAHHGVALQPSY